MRIIAHLDMDAFFAAVEERDHPWLAGMPLVVGADPDEGRGRGCREILRQFFSSQIFPATAPHPRLS